MTLRNLVKFFLPILILLVSAGVYHSLVQSKVAPEKPKLQEKVWQVDLMSAELQSLAPEITLYGRVESPELLNSAAPGGGIVESVFVRNGVSVARGDKLVKLDQRDFASALAQAKANFKDVKNQIEELSVRHQSNMAALETERNLFDLANAEVKRLVRLQQQKLSTDSALNSAHSTLGRQQLAVLARELAVNSYPAQLEILKARSDHSKAKVDETSLAMARTQVLAPFNAIINDVHVSSGDRVMLGQKLVSLYSVDSLVIRAQLPSVYVDSVRRASANGSNLFARINKRFDLGKFRLSRIAGQASASGIDVYFQSNSASTQFRPGELLALSLQLPAEANVIAIPYQAIYGDSVVYLSVENRMQATAVTTVGQKTDVNGQRQLLIRADQINPGDQIVITHLPNAVSGLSIRSSENGATK